MESLRTGAIQRNQSNHKDHAHSHQGNLWAQSFSRETQQRRGFRPILGSNRDKAKSTIRTAISDARARQRAARLAQNHFRETGANLPGSSLAGCMIWKAYGGDLNNAVVDVDKRTGRAKLAEAFRCKSNLCPVCSRIKTNRARSWLRGAVFPAMERLGYSGAMVTFTLSHSFAEDWNSTADDLAAAFSAMWRRVSYHAKAVGSVAPFKALEATVGVNGLHVHYHTLVVYRRDTDPDAISRLQDAYREHWGNQLSALGRGWNHRAFDWKADALNDYLAKVETGHELAAHDSKTPRRRGRTLLHLLHELDKGDKKAGQLWKRAALALGGKTRFHTGGLSKLLGIPSLSDWEDAEDEREELAEFVQVETGKTQRITYPQSHHKRVMTAETFRNPLGLILWYAKRNFQVPDLEGRVRQLVEGMVRKVNEDAKTLELVNEAHRMTKARHDQIMEIAKTRPLSKDEVREYLVAKQWEKLLK